MFDVAIDLFLIQFPCDLFLIIHSIILILFPSCYVLFNACLLAFSGDSYYYCDFNLIISFSFNCFLF